MNRIDILLVDDSLADIELTLEYLEDSAMNATVHICRDGVDALRFLRRQTPHANAVTPDLVLLDLNMPRKGGAGVLAEIDADPALRRIPVVVLTSSQARADIALSYDLGANCYVAKPTDLDEFERVVRAIEVFWFTVAELPPAH